MDYHEILKDIHTRVLMTMRDQSYATHYCYYVKDCTQYEIPHEAILEELNTREHIPNKQEARKIRQEKAKAKQNR